jgi:neutral ceramidase
MTLLRLEADDGTELGMINWFPVHCVSMNKYDCVCSLIPPIPLMFLYLTLCFHACVASCVDRTIVISTNTLVNSDNKGLASLMFEEVKNPKYTLPGKGAFVAAFGQSNEGDVSPNTKGTFFTPL